MRYQDLAGLCKQLNCHLADEDMNRLWGSISFGGRDGKAKTQDFWRVMGGFIRDDREPLPSFTTSSLRYSPVMTSANRISTMHSDSAASASLHVPHFYGVDQSDPTCMHQLTGLRYAGRHTVHHMLFYSLDYHGQIQGAAQV
jgi:hypothetical protein